MRKLPCAVSKLNKGCEIRARTAAIGVTLVMSLGGCVNQPIGPSVAVMPAPNKPFEVFQQDQGICTQYAGQQVAGGAPAANSDAVKKMAVRLAVKMVREEMGNGARFA